MIERLGLGQILKSRRRRSRELLEYTVEHLERINTDVEGLADKVEDLVDKTEFLEGPGGENASESHDQRADSSRD